ncbi:MAG: sterol desaturase family protein [Alphaproteobacteria bacterium]
MDDLQSGTRNKRGDWAPSAGLEIAPFWQRPFDPVKILKWLPGYLFPWNALHMATALAYWFFVVPDVATMRELGWGWALWLLGVNAAAVLVLFGAIELRFYAQRSQGNRFKYNAKFPGDQRSDVFWFKSQNVDNALRTFLISIPLWTAVEVFMLWCFANGYAAWLSWADHPVWLAAQVLLVPAIHEIHFFFIHRLIHWGPLYRWVHSVHHNSINPTPWSSLSMHPVESLLYHAVALWHLVIPSNPIVGLFQLHVAGFGAINGHIGFDRLEIAGKAFIRSEAYAHYLHHKYFEVNYGGEGLVPLDRWFGTWHDGTKAGDARMQARFERKRARMNARKLGATLE